MMVNLTQRLGIPAEFDCESFEFNYPSWAEVNGEFWEKKIADEPGKKGIWRSLMFARSYKSFDGKDDSLPDFERLGLNGRAYFGFRNYRIICPREMKKIGGLRPDITIIPARGFRLEYARTEGHEHLSGLPEIYETILGEVGYLLFKFDKQNPRRVDDAMLVISKEGDHVIFPDGYAHITINLDKKQPAIVTDIVSEEANPSFEKIRNNNGGPYYITTQSPYSERKADENFSYECAPKLRVVKPAEKIELPDGSLLRRGEPMFNFLIEGKAEALRFLEDREQGKYQDFYERAFVPFD